MMSLLLLEPPAGVPPRIFITKSGSTITRSIQDTTCRKASRDFDPHPPLRGSLSQSPSGRGTTFNAVLLPLGEGGPHERSECKPDTAQQSIKGRMRGRSA